MRENFMHKLLVVVILGCGLLCLDCSKSTDSDGTDGNNNHVILDSIIGVVTDYYDNTPLAGVVVTVQSDSGAITNTSDTLGNYRLVGPLVPGEYEVTFTLDGYAEAIGFTQIPDLEELHDSSTGNPLPFVTVFDMQMYALDGTVSGKVLGSNRDFPVPPDDSICTPPPPPSLKVSLFFETEAHLGQEGVQLVPSEYWVLADYAGNFRFTNIPMTDSAKLVVPPFTLRDTVYHGTRHTVPIRSSEWLVIVPPVDTSLFDVTYSYTAYNREQIPIVRGLLAIKYADSTIFNGIWELLLLNDTTATGHIVGRGILTGNVRDEDRIWINLNPLIVDSNIILRGIVSGNRITGTWEYVGFPGVLDHGMFIAVEEAVGG